MVSLIHFGQIFLFARYWTEFTGKSLAEARQLIEPGNIFEAVPSRHFRLISIIPGYWGSSAHGPAQIWGHMHQKRTLKNPQELASRIQEVLPHVNAERWKERFEKAGLWDMFPSMSVASGANNFVFQIVIGGSPLK